MPQVSAFRGLRYDPGHVGSLEGVVAPPAESIIDDIQGELYKQHPANVIRLVTNRDELGDKADDKFDRAGRFFRNWQREGVLRREPDPAIYVYHQVFDFEGRTLTRRGFVGRMRLQSPPTNPSVEFDEPLKLVRSIGANISPVLAGYQDDEDSVQQFLENTIINVAPTETTGEDNTVHRIWPITDIRIINDVSSAIAPRSICIASGWATYLSAIAYRQELGGDELDPMHGGHHVMMNFVNLYDAGMDSVDSEIVEELDSSLTSCNGLCFPAHPLELNPSLLSGLIINSHEA